MSKLSVVGLLVLMSCATAFAGVPNPFDAMRWAKGGKVAITSGSKDEKLTQPPEPTEIAPTPTKVLCGISQSMDSLSLCIDDRWMSTESFELKFKRKVISASKYSLKITGRSKAWVLGEPLGGSGTARREAHKGEKHD